MTAQLSLLEWCFGDGQVCCPVLRIVGVFSVFNPELFLSTIVIVVSVLALTLERAQHRYSILSSTDELTGKCRDETARAFPEITCSPEMLQVEISLSVGISCVGQFGTDFDRLRKAQSILHPWS